MAHLVIQGGDGQARFELAQGKNVVGRSDEADITIKHNTLSRRHTEISWDGDHATMIDLGSKNGTFFLGLRTKKTVKLSHGDTLKFGDIEAIFYVEEISAAGSINMTRDLGVERTWAIEELGASSSVDLETRLRVLLRVSEVLATPAPMAEVLHKCIELAGTIFAADRLTILLAEGDDLRVAAAVGNVREGERGYSRAIVDRVFGSDTAMRFDDLRADRITGEAHSIRIQDIRCAMAAPLAREGKRLGVLYVDNLVAARSFTDDDLQMLVAFANQGAVALDNALMRAELEDTAVLHRTLMRFFPPATARRLVEQPSLDISTTEMEVTILFSDIVGFTKLSSTLKPIEVLALLNEYFTPMAQVVFANGGTLEKYIGDALMAVWGAPFPQPDGADLALNAAVEMQQALDRMNAMWRERGAPEIAMHIGIHTGKVAFGQIGTDRYLQFATIGDATNVAARICDVADADQIVISADTRARLTRASGTLEALPPTHVKGKTAALELYRVDWESP